MVKSFSETLREMCDEYDAYIAPNTIRRDDTNFVYLLLKAIAKGYEGVAQADEALRGKFDPSLCTDSDLVSLAKLVGTEMIEGTGSGLVILCENTGTEDVILYNGTYNYQHEADVVFSFSVASDITIGNGDTVQFVGFTSNKGAFQVSAMSSLPITRSDLAAISPDLAFSCEDNEGQLGSLDESNLDFRRRVLTDNYRQDSISELELALKNLPYLFDCKLIFNQSSVDYVIGGITVPPYHMLVIINGDPRDEIASLIASRGVYPTVLVDAGDVLHVYSDVFVDGEYPVYFTTFTDLEYGVTVSYEYNDRLTNTATIEAAVNAALNSFKIATKHTDRITEGEFYDAVRTVTVTSFTLLDITIRNSGGTVIPYLSVPAISIPKLTSVLFSASTI